MQHSWETAMHLTDGLTTPTVLKGTLEKWSSRHWTPEYLATVLKEKKLKIRIGPLSAAKRTTVLWEVDCVYEDATLDQFCEWLNGVDPSSCPDNPLLKYKREEYWCYVDYKQMAFLFEDHPDILKAVDWTDLGFPDRDGSQSTIWIGSEGAFTPGHYDTYGFNLVAQLYGRKRWYLFPPSQTPFLYPTRIPYEESSVFSPISIANPSLQCYPKLAAATPYIVMLEPGDVLFVPKHWWHFVESVEVSVSINTWVEVESDKESRIEEAVTRAIVSSLMSGSCGMRNWVNPTETICNDEMNYHYVRVALEELSCKSSQLLRTHAEGNSSDSGNQAKENIPVRVLPADGSTSGRDEAVHTRDFAQNQTLMETGKDLRLLTGESSQSPVCCGLSSDNQESGQLSSSLKLDSRRGTEGLFYSDKKGILQDSVKLKRSAADISGSRTQPKLPKSDCRFDEEQSADGFPKFIVPVLCQGQVYRESNHGDSCIRDAQPDDRDLNVVSRSKVREDLCTSDVRKMLVECLTHPSVVSLTTALLQEKFDQGV